MTTAAGKLTPCCGSLGLTPPMGFPTQHERWGGTEPTPDTSLPAHCKEGDQAGTGGHGVFGRSKGHASGKFPSGGN